MKLFLTINLKNVTGNYTYQPQISDTFLHDEFKLQKMLDIIKKYINFTKNQCNIKSNN